MAWWGIGLSIFGVLAGILAGTGLYLLFFFVRSNMPSYEEAGEEQVKTWEGVRAPDFTVTTLDNQPFTLSQFKGKRVVVDCWATWCAPCWKEIPHLNQLAKENPKEELVIIGISHEEHDVVSEFAGKNNIGYPIATADNLPPPYGEVSSLPTTFFIDRNGVIQSVLVGYHDLDQLRREATAPDYTGTVKDKPDATMLELTDTEKALTPVPAWSVPIPGASALCTGDWNGDQSGEILVADGSKKLHVIGLDGTEKESIPLPQEFAIIEIGKHQASGPRLLGYDNWGMAVIVVGRAGDQLWSYSSSFGVDGAHWGDLDGDGTDEMIVGMNGFGGVCAVSPDGKSLWKVRQLGNVWNQAVISATSDQPALVVATEASGSIHEFDKEGNKVRVVRPDGRYYAQMTAARMDSAGAIQIIAIGKGMRGDQNSRVVVCDETGKVAWSAPCKESNSSWRNTNFASGDLNGDGLQEWVFLETDTSLVVASAKGERLSSIPITGKVGSFGVASEPSGRGILTVLQDGNIVSAYKLQ
jgi:thiol-disulfide isomerase/thioredoxin